MFFRQYPCGEVAFDRVSLSCPRRPVVIVHRNRYVFSVFFDGGKLADFFQAGLPCFTGCHTAVERNGAGVRNGTAARASIENFGNGNGSAPEEVCFFPFFVVFFIEHFDEPFNFGAVCRVVFIQLAYFLQDIGHFVDCVIAAFRCGAVAGNTFNIDTDFHAPALTAIDTAVGRFGRNDKVGFAEFFVTGDFDVFFQDVLPAHTVAVFFLYGADNHGGVFVVEDA